MKSIVPVSQSVFNNIVEFFPEPRQKQYGRKRCTKEPLVQGILQVLVMGIGWNNVRVEGASGSSCWRYCDDLQKRGLFNLIFLRLSQSMVDISECAVDTSSISSFRFASCVGWDGKHRKIATKISLITDKKGLPVDVAFGKGSAHDLAFLPAHFGKLHLTRIRTFNADKGYTSIQLRRYLRTKGVFINMGIRKGDYQKKRGPRFRFDEEKYKVRFEIERTFSWLKSFRAIRIRRNRRLSMFKAFIFLALIIVLLRNIE